MVGMATALPVLVVPTVVSAPPALVAPPADVCEGTLEVEGAVIVMCFFLGAINDEEDGDEADETDAQSNDSGLRK
jgi:hypothetical protein